MTKHVYEREVDPSTSDSLARIVSRIVDGSRVLDVGTGSGALGRYLRRHGCGVDGLTYSQEEADRAASSYDCVKVVDLETIDPVSVLGDTRYDVIVCADVLEHLRNAESVLASLSSLLADDGRILVSIPNVTHVGILLALMAGKFPRTREGLLDATHVRFVDRAALEQLVASAGLRVVESMDVRRAVHETEFAHVDLAAVPEAVRRYLGTVPDADVYQFVWVLEAYAGPVVYDPAPPSALPAIDVTPRFGVQLYVDAGQGFGEADSQWAWGEVTDTPQCLRFDALELAACRRLRIDMSDRPGVFELIRVRLLDAQGGTVWIWDGGAAAGATLHDCDCTLVPGVHGGRVFRALSDDPFAIVDLPADAVALAVAVEVVMTAPQRYDDAAFSWAARRYHAQLEQLGDELTVALERERAHSTERELLQRTLDAMRATAWWRLRERIRALRNRFLRRSEG